MDSKTGDSEHNKISELESALKRAEGTSQSKTAFLSRISHDMRTPLNGIIGLAELSKDEKDISVLHENIRLIGNSADFMLNLINDTLDMSKIESDKMELVCEETDVKKFFKDIAAISMTSADEKNISLNFDTADVESFTAIMDKVRCQQIFINLISNAVKFTPAGGRVDVIIKKTDEESENSHLIVIVRDTGIGMSNDFIERIFEPFSQEYNTLTPQNTGSGLGMGIVKSLLELMNGKIEIISEIGKGTEITVDIPLQRIEKELHGEIKEKSREREKKEFENEQEQEFKQENLLKGKRILLCEDNLINAEITMRLLEKMGCIVNHAEDGQQAVDMFKESGQKQYDAVLMDVRMPIVNGIEATLKIRAIAGIYAEEVPIIAMTANAFEEDRQECIEAGMNGYLIKPINPKILYSTLLDFFKRD